MVVQGPGLCHVAHVYARKGATVMMMRRDFEAIRRSEERIGWRTERDGFNLRIEQDKYRSMFGISDNIALIKYYCWDTLQRPHVTGFDLDYESMRQHPLWRPQDERERFAPRQWQPRAHSGFSSANGEFAPPQVNLDSRAKRG